MHTGNHAACSYIGSHASDALHPASDKQDASSCPPNACSVLYKCLNILFCLPEFGQTAHPGASPQ
eukprot:XP_001697552.1 predicted protein [Chlamydomonas reinhardtii]